MKKRKHNSLMSNAGIDLRALEKAEALLVRVIATARKREKRRAGGTQTLLMIERPVNLKTPVPATREEVVKIAARLFTLGGVSGDLSLPLKIAARWIPLADVAAFADEVEGYLRALVKLFDKHLTGNPGVMERCGDSTLQITYGDLESAMKQLGQIARIADGSIELDIGPDYLPPGL